MHGPIFFVGMKRTAVVISYVTQDFGSYFKGVDDKTFLLGIDK